MVLMHPVAKRSKAQRIEKDAGLSSAEVPIPFIKSSRVRRPPIDVIRTA